MKTSPEKMAPVQGYSAGIPWSLHLEAYDAYSKKWSPQPALIDLEGRNCRGGFGTDELDQFVPGWRDKASEIGKLKARLAELETALTATEASDAEQGSVMQQAEAPGAVAQVVEGSWGGPDVTVLVNWDTMPIGTKLYAHPAHVSAPTAAPADSSAAPSGQAWGKCVWCDAASTTRNRSCSAPDGDGHLFEVAQPAPVSAHVGSESALLEYFNASRNFAYTVGHESASVEDENKAAERYEAARKAVDAALQSQPTALVVPAIPAPTEQIRADLRIAWQLLLENNYTGPADRVFSFLQHPRAAPDQPAVVVPAGWRLVPTKLTDDMVVAFMESWVMKVRCIDDPEMDDAYADMLAAAPTPSKGEDARPDAVMTDGLSDTDIFILAQESGYGIISPIEVPYSYEQRRAIKFARSILQREKSK